MRINNEIKIKIFKILDDTLLTKIDEIKTHRALKLGVDIEKRFRWDLFWVVSAQIRDNIDLYKLGYNDDNIDTVLKDYVKNRPQKLTV